MNKRLDIAARLAAEAGPQASLGPSSSPATPMISRRVVLPDARPGPRGRARRMLDRPWNGLPPTGRLAKRLMDIVVSAILLLLLAPLFAVVALAILISTGRPIFYQQQRVGQGGGLSACTSSAACGSMPSARPARSGPRTTTAAAPAIGDWLRHTNIDELPQLFNVLRGDMSLVGPRPERPMFVDEFRKTIPGYDLRHAVPGGMTGWAQVHGWRGRTSLRKRIQYDLDYIERWSIGLDFRVLLMTFQHVFWGKTSWNDSKRPNRPEA